MKRAGLLVLLIVLILSGCSLEYGTAAEYKSIEYYKSDWRKVCFAYEFVWDGDDENTVITVPDKADGYKVVGLGGYIGRGVPYRFSIRFPKGYKLVYDLPKNTSVKSIAFTLALGENVKELNIGSYDEEIYYNEESNEYYKIEFWVECDAKNKTYYSLDGRLYRREDNTLIENFNYKPLNAEV